jgi:release factor glutamine methyltransferase
MTIKQALKQTLSVEDADLLLAHILNKPKEFLILHPKTELNAAQEKTFGELCTRRTKGEPYAYITGFQHFCGLKFKVTPDVLIPRPETEWLVEQAKKDVEQRLGLMGKDDHSSIKILDMGTGSGCIAISLAKQLEGQGNIKITAVDISPAALEVAKQNAGDHKVQIYFIQSDLFSALDKNTKYGLIIANLPYVSTDDYKKLKNNLSFEPKLALTDETNTWDLYKRFLEQSQNYLAPTGTLWIETDPGSINHLSSTLDQIPNITWQKYADLNDLDRYIKIIYKRA